MLQRIGQRIRSLWVGVGIALMVLLLLESVARAGIALSERRRFTTDQAAIDLIPAANDPAGSSWAGYSREFRDSRRLDWHPYVYWRRRPYSGRYVNIDKAGIRRTWNSAASPSPSHLRLFVFGGSTVWGTGARDEFTIPSLISKKLSARLGGTAVWVVNFGETGYVSTQEVITLMLELQRGNVPDIVVFCDGVNDTWSALQRGAAGISQNEHNRAIEFNSRTRLNWREGFVERLALYRLSRRAVRFFGGPRAGRPARQNTPSEPLANAVITAYLHNIGLVNALAGAFGFQTVFFWQPTIFTKKRLSQQEREYESLRSAAGRASTFFDQVYKALQGRISASRIDDLHDLSGIFDDDAGTVFLDLFHITEAGNDRIAEVMTQILQKIALERKK